MFAIWAALHFDVRISINLHITTTMISTTYFLLNDKERIPNISFNMLSQGSAKCEKLKLIFTNVYNVYIVSMYVNMISTHVRTYVRDMYVCMCMYA